ncbi:MAG: DUF2442 domain-containing protein [Holophagaceae bacterium]|nr:DUF2442 domain-containing protein [Holophagaceae bacterium]
MTFHKILHAEPMPDYMLKLSFDTGESKIFNVRPYIRGSWYGELNCPNYFRQVKPSGISVEWPHGQDLDPSELYDNSKCE